MDSRPSALAKLPKEDATVLELLLARTPLIDVRAPCEFERGTLPGASLLPLLNDDERAQVGTAYKLHGQEAAIALGLILVSGANREARLDAWAEFARAHPSAHIFCFRGGLRSQSVQAAVNKERGFALPLIAGGYKRVRTLLIEAVLEIGKSERFVVVTGYTGAAKTHLLTRVQDARRVCDLEGLARHKGSAFGGSGAAQPSQIDFENLLALRLLDLNRSGGAPILLEDESRTIGHRALPLEFFEIMAKAPLYFVESSVQDRARHLIATYVFDTFGVKDGDRHDEKIETLRLSIQKNLTAIERRLGTVERRALSAEVDEACAQHMQSGRLAVHESWVIRLLERYYDRLYSHQLEKQGSRVLFRGSFDEVEARLRKDCEI